MNEELPYTPTTHVLSEGYETHLSQIQKVKVSNKENALNLIIRLCTAITSHFYIPALSLVLAALLINQVGVSLASPIGFLATVLAITLFILCLAALSVTILRFSNEIQGIIQQYWILSTYPFTQDSEKLLQSTLRGQVRLVISLLLVDKRPKLSGRPGLTFRVALAQTSFGMLLVAIGMLVSVLTIEFGVVENTIISTEISLISAFVSVLLGRTLGIVTLSAVSVANSWTDLALIIGIILFPAPMLGPASGNFINSMESVLNQIFTDNYGRHKPLQYTISLVFITILSVTVLCYELWTLFLTIDVR